MTQSPLLGFNNNVKHRGRLFHIQTEDSGVRHPHVITHLFMDGGRILKTIKTSYAEHLGSDKFTQIVRELMKEQHKMMFIALRDGQFDKALDSVPPPSTSTPPTQPHGSFPPASARTVPETTSAAPTSPADRRAAPNPPVARGSAVNPTKEPASPKPPPSPPISAPSKSPSVKLPLGSTTSKFGSSQMAAAPPVVPASGTSASRPHAPSSASVKAAPVDGGPSTGVRPVPRREAPELFGGPPPAGGHSSDSAIVVGEQAAAAAALPAPVKKEQPGSGRYAASRPAAIFSTVRNADAGGSIFGDDLISEKSLDEVILSYLSDDLDTTKK